MSVIIALLIKVPIKSMDNELGNRHNRVINNNGERETKMLWENILFL